MALSQSKWRCTLRTDASGSHEVMEGQTNTYSVHADVVAGATSSLDIYIAALGSSAVVGDVAWVDVASFGTGTGATDTSSTWVYQTGATQVKGASGLSYTAASGGSLDTTVPTITTLAVNNLVTSGTIAATDNVVITFSEAIDPSIINTLLVPGSSTPLAITTGVGHITVAGAVITIANIATLTAATSVSALSGNTETLSLNATGTQLTITVAGTVVGGAIVGAITTAAIAGTATAGIRDINGNLMAAGATAAQSGSGF